MTVSTLEEEKTDQKFEDFFKTVTELAEKKNLEKPVLPRKRGRPKKFSDTLEEIPIYDNVNEMYKSFYNVAFDTIVSKVNGRFKQKGYEMAMHLENSLLKCAKGQPCLKEFEIVTKFYD